MSTIVTRAGKGSALTHNEVDANFTNLNDDKIEAAQTVTLTNKTISGSNNTLSNIGNASLTNSSVTIGSTSVSLGSTATTVSGLTLSSPTVSGNAVISSNSSSDALRITQTGAGNALVVEDSTNPDSTPFVIDASGRLIRGHTAPVVGTITLAMQSVGVDSSSSGLGLYSFNPTNSSPAFELGLSAGATIGSQSVVASGDNFGAIRFSGSDGTAFIRGAQIVAQVDGTPGTNDMPGRLVFSTTADGASTPTERMRIDSAGNVGIGIAPTQKLHVNGNILATGSVDCGTQFLGLATDSATAPSFSFTGDENTGMFRPGADQVALTTNGTARLTVTTAQLTGTLPWRGQNGTAAAPALSASADTNTGIFFPAADSIAFSEGGTEVMRIDSSGNVGIGDTSPSYKLDVTGDINVTGDFRKNGTVFAGLTGGQTGSAPLYAARAWVNFNGTGTVAIRGSGNVSSITDNGVGDYTVNFTTAMSDANYSAIASPGDNGGYTCTPYSLTTSSVRMTTRISAAGAVADVSQVHTAIFR